jgi:hypothetical protein
VPCGLLFLLFRGSLQGSVVSWPGFPSFGVLPVFSTRMYPSGEAAPIAVDLPCGWLDARMDGRGSVAKDLETLADR